MSDLIKINHEARLYVLKCGEGYSCLGFDVCERRTLAMLKWLGAGQSIGADKGTADAYDAYRAAVDACRIRYEKTGEKCPSELTPQLIGLEGRRVEVTAPDGYRKRFYVGKSTGWIPCHLALERRNSSGGAAVYLPEGATFRVIEGARR